jgi:hypothetical protein
MMLRQVLWMAFSWYSRLTKILGMLYLAAGDPRTVICTIAMICALWREDNHDRVKILAPDRLGHG